jgi:hypothetical protein
MPRRDGIDPCWPVVHADSWQEAVALGNAATEVTIFLYPGGSITAGFPRYDTPIQERTNPSLTELLLGKEPH